MATKGYKDASRVHAWYALAVLSLVSVFNYMDRMVLAVLVEPIKQDLHLSDGQIGLLTGFAFAALYATLGVPIGRLADRASRVKILTVCLILWSAMTAATGLARSFGQLFLARMGVGVGEAGCVPAAHSLIGDLFPAERRALAVSIFQAGGLAGLSAGLLVTGILAERLGWRMALASVGLPGIVLGVLLLATVREPRRTTVTGGASGEKAAAALKALLGRPALRHLIFALSIGSFASYGLAQWLPAFYIRTHHLTLTQIGGWTGAAAGIGGILGVVGGGALAQRLIPRDARWEFLIPTLAYGGSAPLYAALVLSPSPTGAIVMQALATFVAASGGGVALSAIQSLAEPRRRATAVALVLFLSSLLGLGAGPAGLGFLSDHLRPAFGDDSLRYALLMSTLVLVWAGLHFWLAGRAAAKAGPLPLDPADIVP